MTSTTNRYLPTSWPLAIAHRGGAGLAPENTLAAFDSAYALGIRHLEIDVRITADGVLVAFHDNGTRRATGVRGRVADLDWPDLAERLVSGQPVAPVEQLLYRYPDARWLIDLKDRRAIGPMAAMLRCSGALERACFCGCPDSWLADLRAVLGDGICTAMGRESTRRLLAAATFGTRPGAVVPAPFVHVPHRAWRAPGVAGRLVRLAGELGTRVVVWTVDDPGRMESVLDAGADGIITDRPDLLRDALVSRNLWAPPPAVYPESLLNVDR